MSERIHPPARNPCGSCPYRRAVPSGVWSAEEYDKLPAYDADTGSQPTSVFLCHQQNGRLCSGWAGCHDMEESMGIRMAIIVGKIEEQDIDAILDYTTTTPLFSSGAEAASHGAAGIESPDTAARKIIDKLTRKRGGD